MNRSRENLPDTISADCHSPIISATIYLRVARRGSIIADVITPKTMKSLFTLLIVVVAITLIGCNPDHNSMHSNAGSIPIDTTHATEPLQNLIRVGDSIEDARKILDSFDKHNSVGGFAFVKRPDDVENIFIQLDPNHMNACAWYSKSTQKITRLSIVCFPNRRSGKMTHSWIPVEFLEFSDDGTHNVQFLKPLTAAELDAREKEAAANQPIPQYPPSSFGH